MRTGRGIIYLIGGTIWLCASLMNVAFAEPSWRSVGASHDPRESSGVALLPNGKVLVVGGHADQKGGGWRLIGTTELYDPSTESWALTGALVEPRQGVRSLAVLANGKVLLAGEHDTLTGAELYDPSTSEWKSTGRLGVGRGNHSTTLLSDGRVLIAGGIDYYGPETPIFASAEIYDPATETWSATGPMASRRFKHAAVRLESGEVLVIGGTATEPSDDRALSSVELYNPVTGTWKATGSLAQARENPSAALLRDGRVLVAGGVIGRFRDYSSLASAEIYDPKTETWTATGAMLQDRVQFTVTLLLDGRVLAVGGSRPPHTALADAEFYDPASGTWSSAGRMKTGRWNHRAVLMPDGTVLVVGGCTMMGQLASAEVFTP